MFTLVYAKKKRVLQVPRAPPVSGDCWWQLEKPDNPYDGNITRRE